MIVTMARAVRTRVAKVAAVGVTAAMLVLVGIGGTGVAWAAQPTVGLGSARPFVVLAGSAVANTGPSTLSGSLGVSPGAAVSGFPPGQIRGGVQHVADAVALAAKRDLVTAYNDAAGRTPVVAVPTELGGRTLVAGVYKASSALGLTGTVTLDAKGNPNAVFIFQAGSTLITGSGSRVRMTGGARACNVFWQVGSSATLGTGSTFVGTVMALTSISVQTGATVAGRVLARNGQVTLDNNRFTGAGCTSTGPSPSSSASASATPTSTPSGTAPSSAVPGGTTTTTAPGADVIPAGHPQTGGGGTFQSGSGIATVIGVVALLGAVLAMGQAMRRRRDNAAVEAVPVNPGVDG